MWITLRFLALWLPLLFVFRCGCAEAWTANEWLGIVEAVTGVSVTEEKTIEPSGDICDNCNGTGKVGDGRVFVECAACDGTGKSKKQKAFEEDSAANAASNFRTKGFC